MKRLLGRYNHPRQIHQMHVCRIIEVPPLKDGTGKEIRALHDLIIQHLRALKSLGHEPSHLFVGDETWLGHYMFEWQRHSHEHVTSQTIKNYSISSTFVHKQLKPHLRRNVLQGQSSPWLRRQLSQIVALSCGQEKHQLYACAKFRSLSHAEKLNLLRSNRYYLNCLCPGHFVKKCKSLNHCKHCQRPHHTLLHRGKFYSQAGHHHTYSCRHYIKCCEWISHATCICSI